MIKHFFRCFSFALVIVAIQTKPARAETVLYCTEELHTGLWKENGTWEVANFELERFSMKVTGDWAALQIGKELFECFGDREFEGGFPIICKNVKPYKNSAINIDKYSLRFVKSHPSLAGYALETGTDSDNLSAGKCEKF